MDALEFLRERKRMCNLYKHCESYPLFGDNCALDPADSDEEYEIIIAAVEQWPKEHPRKTRQSVFLEQWPEAQIDDNGAIYVCPNKVSTAYRDAYGGCAKTNISCPDCRREFWMQEVA